VFKNALPLNVLAVVCSLQCITKRYGTLRERYGALTERYETVMENVDFARHELNFNFAHHYTVDVCALRYIALSDFPSPNKNQRNLPFAELEILTPKVHPD